MNTNNSAYITSRNDLLKSGLLSNRELCKIILEIKETNIYFLENEVLELQEDAKELKKRMVKMEDDAMNMKKNMKKLEEENKIIKEQLAFLMSKFII